MAHEHGFLEEALKEWQKLDASLREQSKSRLSERSRSPRVPPAKLGGHSDRNKIPLRSVGCRLVHEARDGRMVAVGKRERNAVYNPAASR